MYLKLFLLPSRLDTPKDAYQRHPSFQAALVTALVFMQEVTALRFTRRATEPHKEVRFRQRQTKQTSHYSPC